MRFVFDTDVIVAAVRSPSGASAELVRAAQAGQIALLCSVALFVEYEATCTRAEHLLASGWSITVIGDFLDSLSGLLEPVEVHYLWRPRLRDPADEMVLEAAVNGQAQAIVSFNHRDFGSAPQEFGIQLLLPRDALQLLRSTTQKGDGSHD